MKKIIAVLLYAAFLPSAFATIRTVSNLDSAAQYRTIQAAIDASSPGDSVYVNGSPYNYAAFTLTKKLAIFGPGWSPNKDIIYFANVQGCTLRSMKGSELHGLIFISDIAINDDNAGVDSIKFIRNRFQGITVRLYYPTSAFYLEGNWFDDAAIGSDYGYPRVLFTFRNNIFYRSSNAPSVYGFSGDNNNLFDHNLWYGTLPGNGEGHDCFNSCSNLKLNNNIFVHRNAAYSNSGSTFRNNITYLTTNDTAWKSPNVDGLGNIAGKSPQMVNEANVEAGIDNPLLNFTIPSGPANNAGTDAKDMGLLFDPGLENWTRSRAANLPFISKMTLTSNSILVGQKVRFTVDSKSN